MRNKVAVCVSEPPVAVTVIRYVPAAVSPEVVIVMPGPSAGGTSDSGLTVHTGKLLANWVDVATQLNETGLSKPPVSVRLMTEVAALPGFTPAGGERGERAILKLCPKARDIGATAKSDSNRTKRTARGTGLGFNMNG